MPSGPFNPSSTSSSGRRFDAPSSEKDAPSSGQRPRFGASSGVASNRTGSFQASRYGDDPSRMPVDADDDMNVAPSTAPTPVSVSVASASSPRVGRPSFSSSGATAFTAQPESSGAAPRRPSFPSSRGRGAQGGFEAGSRMGPPPMYEDDGSDDHETSVAQDFSPTQSPTTGPASSPVSRPRNMGGFESSRVGAGSRAVQRQDNDDVTVVDDVNQAPVTALDGPLPVRLVRLIDEVAAHRGWRFKEIEDVRRRAALDPVTVEAEFDVIMRDEIQPKLAKRRERYATIQQAQEANPHKMVFMMVMDDQHRLIGMDRAVVQAEVMYEGQIVETVAAHQTMFPPPSVLLAKDIEVAELMTEAQTEAAFADPTPVPPPVSRGPRF